MVDTGVNESVAGASRSLKRLAKDSNDLTGLIAYGLFKIQQSEWANSATPDPQEIDRYHLTLQQTQILSLRANANEKLTDWVESLKSEWQTEVRAEVEEEFDTEMVENIVKKLEDKVREELARIRRNSLLRDLMVGVGAWAITLAITALIVFVAYGPTIGEAILRMKIVVPATELPSKTP